MEVAAPKAHSGAHQVLHQGPQVVLPRVQVQVKAHQVERAESDFVFIINCAVSYNMFQ